MDAVAIFIDGSNFYNKLKELGIRHTRTSTIVVWPSGSRMDVLSCTAATISVSSAPNPAMPKQRP